MSVGILTIHLHLPGCTSLKEKRGRIKPILNRLHREFNVSVAEVDCQDIWREAKLACALISNDHAYTQRALQAIVGFMENSFPQVELLTHQIEMIL
jgi:uncharacterized protein YlxP (DUF503 family)